MQLLILLSVAAFLSSTNALVIPAVEKRSSNGTLSAQPELPSVAPLNSASTDAIPHKYIVMLKNQLSENDVQDHKTWVAQKRSLDANSDFLATIRALNTSATEGIISEFNIGNQVKGYSGYFSDDTINELQLSPQVAYIEQDAVVKAYGSVATNTNAPWNLARISQREALNLTTEKDYYYNKNGGAGVFSWLIDSGVDTSHQDFKGKAIWGGTPENKVDTTGHGTHAAGIIGSSTYGVAPATIIAAVQIFDEHGFASAADLIDAIQFVSAAHEVQALDPSFKATVLNLSLGMGRSRAINDAVDCAAASNIYIVSAAGDANDDACKFSPASSNLVITVGSSTRDDKKADSSNYGKCVDIFAPGEDIISTTIPSLADKSLGDSHGPISLMSGTSMAAPHVAGLVSYFLSLAPSRQSGFFCPYTTINPVRLKKAILEYATKGALKGIGENSPNLLAYNGGSEDLSEFWHYI